MSSVLINRDFSPLIIYRRKIIIEISIINDYSNLGKITLKLLGG